MWIVIAAVAGFYFLSQQSSAPSKQAPAPTKTGTSGLATQAEGPPPPVAPSGAAQTSYQSRLASIGAGLGTAIGGIVDIAEGD